MNEGVWLVSSTGEQMKGPEYMLLSLLFHEAEARRRKSDISIPTFEPYESYP